MKLAHKFLAALLILSFLLGGLPAQPAHAVTTRVVTTNIDKDDHACTSDCSLREAVLYSSAGDTITFASSLAGKTILLYEELLINKSLIIDGSNLGSHIKISGAGAYTVFIVAGSNIEAIINHVDIINGVGSAGGIINGGSLTVSNSNFSNNSGESGGITNGGSLTVSNSTFSNNHSTSQGMSMGGGAINNSGTLIVTDSTFSGNDANWYGGGINNAGGVCTVSNSTFSGNVANRVMGFDGGNGGGIYNSSLLMVENSTFSGNIADDSGGGIYNNGISAGVKNSTFSGNSAVNYGGGIYNNSTLSVANATFSANSATYGGGLYSASGSTLGLENTILANSASNYDCLNAGTLSLDTNNLIESNGLGGSACGTPLVATDPMLGSLASNGGSTKTHALQVGSLAIDNGDDDVCTNTVGNIDQRGVTHPVDGNIDGTAACDIGAFEYTLPLTAKSSGSQDGWILESSETSTTGGTKSSTASTLRIGDDAAKKQYRSILSFSTGASLPDDALILKVMLKIKRQGVIGGGNPITAFQGFMVDIKKGYFGTSSLAISDFQASASKSYGPFKPALSGGWYSIDLTGGKSYINKLSTGAGLTQIRLRFKLDDNNNTTANYLSLYSGNASSSYRPQLIIEYYDP
jgi:CSLREA domain-containing protein